MTIIPYQRLHPEELADLETRYGRELSEAEALYLLRQEREWAMREHQFYGSTKEVMREPDRSGESDANNPSGRVVTGAHRAANECENLTCQDADADEMAAEISDGELMRSKLSAEEIVFVSETRWPPWAPAAIFVGMAIGEAWLAAHYHAIEMIRSWFR